MMDEEVNLSESIDSHPNRNSKKPSRRRHGVVQGLVRSDLREYYPHKLPSERRSNGKTAQTRTLSRFLAR